VSNDPKLLTTKQQNRFRVLSTRLAIMQRNAVKPVGHVAHNCYTQ